MNILFVNYGDFTTNSLNHIAGFAHALGAAGHACVVVVPGNKETVSAIRDPRFIPATFAEALAQPSLFPDGRPADVIHAWTPREGVRKFVLSYQRALKTPARLIVHLEDNERHLLEAYTGKTFNELRTATPEDIGRWLVDGLPHPLRHESFLRVADGVTHIVEKLREHIPAGIPTQLLPPPVDFELYAPQNAAPDLRAEHGLRPEEKVLVFTGSNTFANEPEMRELYLAVSLLNQRGTPTRLIRTGFNSPTFLASLTFDYEPFVLDLGFIEKAKLPQLLGLADVLVQPGHPGAFNDFRLPSKLPEFLASGKPVVLPPTNLALLMQDGRDAVFLKTGAPEEIADICERLFQDPNLCARLGKNGVSFAHQHFDATAITRELYRFYTATLAAPARTDWSLIADRFSTETSIVVAQVQQLAPATLAPDLAHLGLLIRQLELSLDESRSPHLHQLSEARRHQEMTAQHVKHLEEEKRLTAQHVANLERTVATLQPQFERSEILRHQAETLLSAARKQMTALDQEVDRLENVRNQLQSQIDFAHHQISELRAQGAALADQSARAIADVGSRLREQLEIIRQREDVIRQREEKIRVMQSSFSWQVTAPLRFLRRQFSQPKPRPAPPPSPVPELAPLPKLPRELTQFNAPAHRALPFSVDYPNRWGFAPRKLSLRGWCFADDGTHLKHIRATINTRTYPGVYGLKRMDVLAAVREKPQAEYCGWKVEVELFEGDTFIVLEVGDVEGRWQVFFRNELQVGQAFDIAELTSYERWVVTYDTLSNDRLSALRESSRHFPRRPLISIIVPVYNTPEKWLTKAISSIGAQTYNHWELCLADDASTAPHIRPLLEKHAAEDPRIKVTFREKNGHISAASNSALALAAGEYIALLDHDDELTPHALHEVVAVLNAHPNTDFIYSDEDKIDEEGHRHEPYFKPDFLPDLFLAQNYTSHLTVYRAALVKAAGGFRVGYEGSQDWDLALRIVSLIKDPSRIRHIPKVLYHWRAIPGSTALLSSEKNYPVEAARRALTDHFALLNQPIELIAVPGDHWRIRYPLPAQPPLVSLLIPTRNGLKFLQRCIESILEKTTYPNYEIVIIDNNSDDPATLAYLKQVSSAPGLETRNPEPRTPSVSQPKTQNPKLETPSVPEPGTQRKIVRVLTYDFPFNYSAINNFAAKAARGSVLGLLNNDLEVITPGWLDEMVSQALRPGVGCVGAMLYYPNDTIQHAGVIVGLGGVAGHAFRDFPRNTEGVFNRARLVQNYGAVTAACLVIQKKIYEQVGGFDDKNLSIAFNDIDFCLKVRAAGYRNLWTPFAELYHHESVSRGAEDTPEKHERFRAEVEYMMKRWAHELKHDPAYNPNLTLELTDFTLAAPPRPWVP